MKKFIAIILGLFLVLGFTGCNSDGSDMDIDLNEFMTAPTNLSITGNTLSWDAVENSNGYIVYADGEEADKVDETSFDFSDLNGDIIIFQVQTRAPRGYEDSALSVSIAYVANKEAEILLVSESLEDAGFFVSDGFAEELVNKGMVSTDIDHMITTYGEFVSMTMVVDDFDGYVDALRYLVEREEESIEALVSAVVKELLPIYLQEQIDYYQIYADTAYSDSERDYYLQQIDMYQQLLDEIEENPDAVILALVATVEYFISVEEMINDNLVSLIDGLSETENPDDLNASELNEVKEEVVSVLRETMPTEQDMVLVMEVFDLLASLSGATIDYTTDVENYKGKLAAQTLYTMEAFVNFLDTFDEDYFEEVVAQLTSDAYYEVSQMEVVIETIIYFDKFKEDNDNLLDTINEVFTEEEQEAMFNEYLGAMDEINAVSNYGSIIGSLDSFNFQQLLSLQVIFEDSFDAVLDEFVETDGEVLRALAIYNSFTSWPEYMNQATGEQYDTWMEYYSERDLANLDVLVEVVNLLNEYFKSIDEEAMNEMTDFLVETVFEVVYSYAAYISEMYGGELPFTDSEVEAAKDAIALGLDEANADMLELVQNLFEYLDDEDVIADYKQLQIDIDAYYVDTYGEDYYDTYYYEDDYSMYASIIFVAQHYDAFMTNNNSGLLDDILVVVFDSMGDSAFLNLTDLTSEDVDLYESTATSVLTLLSDEFDEIRRMDADNLSDDDIAVILDFQEALEALLYSEY